MSITAVHAESKLKLYGSLMVSCKEVDHLSKLKRNAKMRLFTNLVDINREGLISFTFRLLPVHGTDIRLTRCWIRHCGTE